MAAGRNASGTQLTHARWVVSGRWSAWGMSPRPNRPTASSTRGRHAAGSARTRQMPTATWPASTSGSRKNQMTTCCVDAERRQRPPRHPQQGHLLERAVEVVPRRRQGQRAAAPQPEHRVEHHALDRVARTGGGELDEVRRDAGRQPDRSGRHRAAAEAPEHAAVPEGDADDEVGAEQQGQAGQQPGPEEQSADPRPTSIGRPSSASAIRRRARSPTTGRSGRGRPRRSTPAR